MDVCTYTYPRVHGEGAIQVQLIVGVGPDPMAHCKMQKDHQHGLVPQQCPSPSLNAASGNRSCLPHTSFLF